MDKEKILIVEDDPDSVRNYKILLENEDLDVYSVQYAKDALELLKTNYYAVVILDLSLHPSDAKDRTSKQVQEYLIGKSEGTKHIVVSGTADIEDVQELAFKYKASAVIFKYQLLKDKSILVNTVSDAVKESIRQRPDLVKEAYELFATFSERQGVEHEILKLLDPDKGKSDWVSFKEKFLKSIAPLSPHLTRRKIEFKDNFILGLFWSRKLGTAISICIASNKMAEETCTKAVDFWLGWPHANGTKTLGNGIQGYVFVETDLSPEDFSFSQNK